MPQTMVDVEVVSRALQLACRAPSVHNSQPWRWVSEDAVLHLFVDRRRWVHSADRSGREAIISCGAVLDHLRVAMVAAGWQAHIERFPNPNNRDHLASVEFSPLEFVTDTQRERDRGDFAAPNRPASAGPSDVLGVVRTGVAQQRRRERRDARCALR